METVESPTVDEVAEFLRESLENGKTVEIEGLGSLRLSPKGGFEFKRCTRSMVFLAYADEDYATVEKLFAQLEPHVNPWLDKKRLLPGQNWPRAIESTIGLSDFFIPCFSRNAVSKRGMFQSELRWALACADLLPLDQVFVIPVRLEPCVVPPDIASRLQYVDLFPDWNRGVKRIVASIERHQRRSRPKP